MDSYDISISSFFNLLRRQARFIILTVVVVLAGAGVVVFTLKPMYTASTLIMVDPSRKNLLEADFQALSSAADSARIDSEVEILRSDTVLLQVIEAQNLIADPEFGVSLSLRDNVLAWLRLGEPSLPTGEAALNMSLSKLRSAVSVQRRGLTYLISLQVRSSSPARAAELANAVGRAYIADQLSSKVNSALDSRDILQARIARARESILQSEGQFDDFISSNIEAITRDTGRTDLADVQRQIDELTAAREQTVRLADEAQQSLANGDFAALTSSLQSQAIAELDRQRAELQQSIAGAAEGSPDALNLQSELQAIEERLRQEATTAVAGLRDQITQTQSAETALREQLRDAMLRSPLSADTLTQMYELQQNAELARAQYQQLLTRIQDLEAQAALQVADSRIVSPALPPNSPSFPNTGLILAMATLAALGLGIALALVYENVLGGFVNDDQLEAVLRVRVAASIPKVKGKGGGDGHHADLMVDAPLSVFAESVRRVRAAVDQSIRKLPEGPHRAKVIMISSTAPAEGKTTMALSLARSYALSGRDVLLVDCDLRKPSIHKHLGLEPSTGLLEFLTSSDSTAISSIARPDSKTGATVILGSRRSGVPTDQLVAGAYFQRMIEAARKTFDVIVIDTPPLGPVVDGAYIAPYADAIVFLVRWAATSQKDAREAIRTLDEARAETTEIFAVLSQQEESRIGYKNKYGDYYAEYA